MRIIAPTLEDSEESGTHDLPSWYIKYCDLFVPADHCMYCWFGRGAVVHGVGGLICGLLIALLLALIIAR